MRSRISVIAFVDIAVLLSCAAGQGDYTDFNETESDGVGWETQDRRLEDNSSSPSPSPSGGGGGGGGSGNVGGDPITYYGDVRAEFEIPVGKWSALLQVPDMDVLGMAYQGNGAEQWIDRVAITTNRGEKVVEISIKKNLMEFNRSRIPPNAFETLEISMDKWAINPLVVMPPPDAFFYHLPSINIGFGRVRQPGHGQELGPAPRREAVVVVSDFVKLVVMSSSAIEYYGDDPYLALKYSHLDLQVLDMKDNGEFRGILPELWGLAPVSNRTRALTKSHSSEGFMNSFGMPGPQPAEEPDVDIIEGSSEITLGHASHRALEPGDVWDPEIDVAKASVVGVSSDPVLKILSEGDHVAAAACVNI